MPILNKQVKCPLCGKTMEKGEKFEFEKFKWHGKEQAYPVHPAHLVNDVQHKKLADVIAQAAENGHEDATTHTETDVQQNLSVFGRLMISLGWTLGHAPEGVRAERLKYRTEDGDWEYFHRPEGHDVNQSGDDQRAKESNRAGEAV